MVKAGGAVMKRRQVIAGLFLVSACLCGCETLRHEHRPKPIETADDSDDPNLGEVQSKPPKGFFKGSRLPGGLSPEAREIENNFGIQ